MDYTYGIDVSLNSQTGQLQGDPKVLAWLVETGVMQANQVIPRLDPRLKNAVELERILYRKAKAA